MLEYRMFRMCITDYFRQTQERLDHIDATLPNAYVNKFENSQSIAFPSAQPLQNFINVLN